ncbi:MAG: DNA-protecting protein DprA [Erysipelotrichaceae bacterium]|nr:DNA-protecting protein DprA [Erysipelotrichaceae bacterium]
MEEFNIKDARKKIIYYALKYKGDWDEIFNAITRKEEYDEEFVNKELKNNKWKLVTVLDKEYPQKLKNIMKPPFVLFYYGDFSLINEEYSLGVVGSRNHLDYGSKVCEKLIGGLSKDIVIVSGLAKGIDAFAHQAALDNDLKTIAVLGVGIDRCYPKENFKLYMKIKKCGLLISEYPYKEVVSVNNFPMRNRLIAALSKSILIPECKGRSGTLITVRFALEQGKDILVVPCSILEPLYNNQLILEGAIPVICSKDIEEQIK